MAIDAESVKEEKEKEKNSYWARWHQYAETGGVVVIGTALKVLATVSIDDIGAGVLHRR